MLLRTRFFSPPCRSLRRFSWRCRFHQACRLSSAWLSLRQARSCRRWIACASSPVPSSLACHPCCQAKNTKRCGRVSTRMGFKKRATSFSTCHQIPYQKVRVWRKRVGFVNRFNSSRPKPACTMPRRWSQPHLANTVSRQLNAIYRSIHRGVGVWTGTLVQIMWYTSGTHRTPKVRQVRKQATVAPLASTDKRVRLRSATNAKAASERAQDQSASLHPSRVQLPCVAVVLFVRNWRFFILNLVDLLELLSC